MIGIVDYSAGNLLSISKAFDYLGMPNKILQTEQELGGVKKLVLPGVGSFGHALRRLNERQWLDPIQAWLHADRPFLGICLGMQLLFSTSEETEGVTGLDFFQGDCLRFNSGKVPQIGWNDVQINRDTPLLAGIASGTYFYFVHSYYVSPQIADVSLASTTYGRKFTSIAGNGRVFGVQFHPEKSGDAGLRLLENWGNRC